METNPPPPRYRQPEPKQHFIIVSHGRAPSPPPVVSEAWEDPPESKYGDRFKARAAQGLGGTMIILALFNFTAASIATWMDAQVDELAVGYWCGSFFMLCGVMAAHAGRTRQDCAIVFCIISSILSLAFAGVQLWLTVSAMIDDLEYRGSRSDLEFWLILGADIALVTVASLQCVLSIPLLCIASCAVCCKPSDVEPGDTDTSRAPSPDDDPQEFFYRRFEVKTYADGSKLQVETFVDGSKLYTASPY